MNYRGRFPVIGVIADDLPGATLCGAILRKAGLRTVVVGHKDRWPERPEAIVVNVGARLMNVSMREPASSGRPLLVQDSSYIVQQAARKLVSELHCERLELRVDGGLRRSYSNELRGLVAGSACENPILFAAPAYPAAGRITKNGEQISFVSGESSGEHAVNAIPLLFGDRPAMIVPHEVSSMGAESIAQWITRGLHRTRNVLGDAESDQNLRALAGAAALLTHDHDVITLSSGAWLQFHPVLPARPEFVLVAMGLPTCSNERQLSQLLKGARRKLVFPREALSMSLYGGGLAEIIRRAETIIIKAQPRDDTDPTVPVDGRARLEAANDVANAVAAMLETAHGLGVRCRGIVATGDHTASSVVVGLAANAIEPVRELVPHCAVEGRVSGGQWTGLPIIMKSGSVGGALALCDLVEQLHKSPWTGG